MSSPSIEFLSSLTLIARDPAALAEFYGKLLGLSFRSDEYGYEEPFFFAGFNETQIAIHPEANFPALGRAGGAARLAFEVRDLEAVTEHAEGMGLEVIRPVSRRAPAVSTASVRDPEGNEVTFTHRPDWWHTQIVGLRKRQLVSTRRRTDKGLWRSIRRQLSIRWGLLRRKVQFELIDPWAYRLDRVFLVNRDLRGFSHLVSSREGLFAINREGYRKVLRGQFFGLTVRGSSIFAFQANGHLVSKKKQGRILRLDLEDGRIRQVEVIAKGLGNGCHQIDFIGSELAVMDTYDQQIVLFNEDFSRRRVEQPLPKARSGQWDKGYCHANSIVRYGGEIYLLKHNGSMNTGRNSSLVRLDGDFQVIEEQKLPGAMCHNVVFLEDGRLLICDSRGGTIINREGVVMSVGPAFTRGISVDEDTLVVGESAVADRRTRQLFSAGRAYFYDRDFRLQKILELPAAVTEIRKIDGRDLSLSNCPRPWSNSGAGAGAEGEEGAEVRRVVAVLPELRKPEEPPGDRIPASRPDPPRRSSGRRG